MTDKRQTRKRKANGEVNKGPLTQAEIQSYIKDGRPAQISDGNSFYFVINDAGHPFWALRYTKPNGKRAWTYFSSPKEMSLAEARAEAATIKLKIKREGLDPASEKKKAKSQRLHTVADLWDDFYERESKRIENPNIIASLYKREIQPVIGKYELAKVEPTDIRFIIERINEGYGNKKPRKTVANKTLYLLTKIFNHAQKLNLVQYNPASIFTAKDAGGTEKPKEFSLNVEQVAELFNTLRKNIGKIAIQDYWGLALLLSTGVRKMELYAAQWSEFDLDNGTWHLPAERTKSRRRFTQPLAPQTIEWLLQVKAYSGNSTYLFPSRKKGKSDNNHVCENTVNHSCLKLKKEGKIPWPEFDPHSLRHTCRSLLSKLKVPTDVAERYINHSFVGLQKVYDNHDYYEERKEAAVKLADILAPLINIDNLHRK